HGIARPTRLVLVSARHDLLVASGRVRRFESGRRQPERLDHARPHRLLETRPKRAGDSGGNEPEAAVAVREELACRNREALRLAFGQLQEARIVERLGPFAGQPGLVTEQLPDGRLDVRAWRRLVEGA